MCTLRLRRGFYLSIVFFTINVIFLGSGCGTTPMTTYTPLVYNQNEDVLFDNISYRISDVFWAEEISPRYMKKKPNATFLVINLTLTNVARKPVDKVFNPIFKLIDSVGAEFESSPHLLITEGLEIKMMTQPLNPRVSMQGYVVFDVPQRNKYKLRILSPFYALEAFHSSVKVLGFYFYYVLDPKRTLINFEL